MHRPTAQEGYWRSWPPGLIERQSDEGISGLDTKRITDAGGIVEMTIFHFCGNTYSQADIVSQRGVPTAESFVPVEALLCKSHEMEFSDNEATSVAKMKFWPLLVFTHLQLVVSMVSSCLQCQS